MREALVVGGLLVLAVGLVALRAVLDGRRSGVPASIAVLAPVAEVARLLRTRAVGARRGASPIVAGVLLLLAPVLRVSALPVAQTVLGGPLGVGWLVLADALWWIGGALLTARGARLRWLGLAAATELPLLLALAAPVVAARSGSLAAVRRAQQDLPFAAEAPVAVLLLLAVGGVLLPWAVTARGSGAARLLIGAGIAAQPVSVAAVATVAFLGADPGAGRLLLLSAVLVVVIAVAARRFPVLHAERITRLALTVLLPLAAVQLAIVVALTLLAA